MTKKKIKECIKKSEIKDLQARIGQLEEQQQCRHRTITVSFDSDGYCRTAKCFYCDKDISRLRYDETRLVKRLYKAIIRKGKSK